MTTFKRNYNALNNSNSNGYYYFIFLSSIYYSNSNSIQSLRKMVQMLSLGHFPYKRYEIKGWILIHKLYILVHQWLLLYFSWEFRKKKLKKKSDFVYKEKNRREIKWCVEFNCKIKGKCNSQKSNSVLWTLILRSRYWNFLELWSFIFFFY